MKIFYSYTSTPLGLVEISCSDKAISSLHFVDQALQHQTAHPLLTACTIQLQQYFDGARIEFDLPVAQTGTGFQQQIWKLLEKIPFGKTISYLELSQQYGNPLAIRAVAAANGRNKLWLLIPCHRVVGSDGSLTGYAGGLWRKKWLLHHEAQLAGTGVSQLELNLT